MLRFTALGQAAVAMKWDFQFADEAPLLTITAVGKPVVEGFREFLDAVIQHPRWRPRLMVLCDLRDLDTSGLSVGTILKLLMIHAPCSLRGRNSPIAMVVARPGDYGMMRMWLTYAHGLFGAIRIFYSIEEAGDWLRAEFQDDGGSSKPA